MVNAQATAPLSLSEIRDHAEYMANHHGGYQIIDSREVLALVAVAEVANKVMDDTGAAGPWSDLDAALARFEAASRDASPRGVAGRAVSAPETMSAGLLDPAAVSLASLDAGMAGRYEKVSWGDTGAGS